MATKIYLLDDLTMRSNAQQPIHATVDILMLSFDDPGTAVMRVRSDSGGRKRGREVFWKSDHAG